MWLAIEHCKIGVWTRPTLIGAKHFNSDPTVASFTHHISAKKNCRKKSHKNEN